MASIYKRKNGIYYITYYPKTNVRRTVRGCKDKAATEALARKIETEAWQRRAGLIDEKTDRYAEAKTKPLADMDSDGNIVGGHLADFHAVLMAKGVTAKHAKAKQAQAARVVELCNAKSLSDLSPTDVQLALRTLRDEEGLSLQTLNHYLRSIKQFSRWLWRDRRISENVLFHLSGYNARLDRRHDRRALSDEEAERVVRTTIASCEAYGLSGVDRAMLYMLAMGTGFRRNELRSLTPESFDLLADPPTITVEAAYSKRRRRDAQPIRPDLAVSIHRWLKTKRSGLPVFETTDTHWHRTSKMLAKDLQAAREAWLEEASTPEEREQQERGSFLTYRDAAGLVADFHALRHTYITNVGRSGASMKTHQELARHSEPGLTMRYTHPRIHDKMAALESLPSLASEEPKLERTKATGTDDIRPLVDATGGESRSACVARGHPCMPTPVITGQDSHRNGDERTAPQAFDKTTTCQRMSTSGCVSHHYARQDSNL